MMLRLLGSVALAALALVAALPAAGGEVKIGLSPFGSAGGSKTCHVTAVYGPTEAVENYRRRQEERFEEVDPSVLEQLRTHAQVFVELQDRCSRDSSVPEKIVLTDKGKREPILTIPLVAEQVTFKDAMGAEFTGFNAIGEVGLDELQQLAGKDFDFHLILDAKKPYKDKGKKDYAEKILE